MENYFTINSRITETILNESQRRAINQIKAMDL